MNGRDGGKPQQRRKKKKNALTEKKQKGNLQKTKRKRQCSPLPGIDKRQEIEKRKERTEGTLGGEKTKDDYQVLQRVTGPDGKN